jgi:hypothetical protein
MRYWIGAESLYGNGGSEVTYRFQRVSPMEVSPHDSRVVYYGSQYVHRTRDGGRTWTRLSPDLTLHPEGTQGASGGPITRDATGEEVYSTLYSIRESPVQKGLIWTGSNDGLVFVSRNDGESWSNVTPPQLASGGRVQNIEPSPHRPGTAYVALYRYLLGDFAPYIYRTDDFGKTWTRLTDGKNGIAADEPTRVVREDPDRPGLLYAGTEFGIYISFDNGAHWQSFQLNLPVTPVTDIKVAHKDLVLSTQGRSFWILDNLTPLHQLKDGTGAQTVLFVPREAVRTPGAGALEGLTRTETIRYPQTGAQIDYYLPAASEVSLEILDEAGKPIRKFSSHAAAPTGGGEDDQEGGGGGGRRGRVTVPLDGKPGMHRFTWDLQYPGPWLSASRPEGPNGPTAVPGKYQVRITAGAYTATQPFTLIEDPRITKDGVTTADLREQFEHNIRVRDLVSDVNKAVARIRAAPKSPALDEISAHIITPTIRYSKPELQTHIQYLYSLTTGTDQKIGRDATERYEILRKELDARLAELNKVVSPAAP